MDKILNMGINEMAGLEFNCSCGKYHTLNIEHIEIGNNVLPKIVDIAKPFADKPIFIFSDTNTFATSGSQICKLMDEAGFNIKNFVFQSGKNFLIPDENAVGRLCMELEMDTGLIIANGSGTINDIAKFIAYRMGIPYVIVCTAPSMDGYASTVAALICDGKKVTFNTTLPYAIIGDIDIMKDAPMPMIHAGFGDIIGKLTALADWRLAHELTGEYYCETCEKLVRAALEKVIDNVEGIKNRQEQGITYLVEALILTGVAMGLIEISRPASGAEHMMSHFWEMDFIEKGEFPEFHGIKVGISTPIVVELFKLIEDEIPSIVMDIIPSREYVEQLLAQIGGPVTPKDIGIKKDSLIACLMGAHKIRERYSIFTLAVEKGRLEEFADKVASRIYG